MAKCYRCFREDLKHLSEARVGDALLAPVCKCGEHYVLQSVDMENLTAFIACPLHASGSEEHEAHKVDLYLTGEWDALPDLYVLVHARRYAGIPCILKGHIKEVAMQLAKFARSKCKGRMTDASVRYYANAFEAALRRDAEKEETTELQLVAYSSPFEVGINAGRSQKVVVPATLHDIYDEPVEFEWRDVRYAK
jgi:hypothetical protein